MSSTGVLVPIFKELVTRSLFTLTTSTQAHSKDSAPLKRETEALKTNLSSAMRLSLQPVGRRESVGNSLPHALSSFCLALPGPAVLPRAVKEGSRLAPATAPGEWQPSASDGRQEGAGKATPWPAHLLRPRSPLGNGPAPGNCQCHCGSDTAPCKKQWPCRTGNIQTCSIKMALTIGVGSAVVCSQNLTRRTGLVFLNRQHAYRLTKYILGHLFFSS